MSHDTWLIAGNCVELNISNLWSPNHEYLKCLSLFGCFANVETFFSVFFIQLALSSFFSQMNVCNKKIHCVRGDEIPLCYSLGN